MRSICIALAISAALATTAAPASTGNLTLKWNACENDGGVSDIVFPCDSGPGGGASMYFTFTPSLATSTFLALDFFVDVGADAGAIPDFWRFTTLLGDYCNTGLELRKHRPLPQCASATDPWDATTHAAIGYLAEFGGIPNHGRIVGSIYRETDNPFALTAGTEYFGFEIRILADDAVESGGTCYGCSTPTVIVAAQANVISGPSGHYEVITEVDNTCITTNGGLDCWAVPTRNRTWGQLKSLYR